jgi:hypothetical protein
MQWHVNSNGHVQLKIMHMQKAKKLVLDEYFKVFGTKLVDGMITLACPQKAIQILISMADPAQLATFLDFLSMQCQHSAKCTIRFPDQWNMSKENLFEQSKLKAVSSNRVVCASVLNRNFGRHPIGSKRLYKRERTSSPALKRGRRGSPHQKRKHATGMSDSVELSAEQNRVLQLCLSGQSLFFTGCAGTGKSLLLKSAIKALQASGKKVYPTSLTSVAGCNINGTTVHM